MTDLELLEAAAKAAGVCYDSDASKPHPKSGAFWGLWLKFDREPSEYDRRYWNPLTDDGDALRLAVKLRLAIDIGVVLTRVDGYQDLNEALATECHGGEAGAATRRAIVRAAVAIGAREGAGA